MSKRRATPASTRSQAPDADDPARAGELAIVATPIGNLEDITLRALRTMKEATAVLAEDTRRTRVLLSHFEIQTPLRALHAHSPAHVVDQLVDELTSGARFALVTDAGTPIVSDPGNALVQAAVARGVQVTAIPGPSAVTAALTVAAIPCDGFRFFGFLPRGGKGRRLALSQIAASPVACVMFESPQRLSDTLRDLSDLLGPTRQAAVCRELTKLHEEVTRGDLTTLRARFAEEARGEITLVIAGSESTDDPALIDPDTLAAELLATGMTARDAARSLAEQTGLPKREAYALVQTLERTARDGERSADVDDEGQ